MSHTQLTTASDEEMPGAAASKPLTPRWRGWGLAVTSVGLVCMVGSNWPRKQVTPLQRFGQMRDAMIKTLDLESLATSSDLRTKIEFVLGEDGAEDPSAMEINVKIATDTKSSPPDRRLDDLQTAAEITFNAKEGNGLDLKVAFDNMILAAVAETGGMEGLDGVEVTRDGDSVTVSVPMQDVPAQGLDATFENQPEISANFKFGRDLDTIFDHLDLDNGVTIWSGLHFTVDAKFKGLVIDMIKGLMPSSHEAHWAEALALVAGKLELRYKTADELGDKFADVPTVPLPMMGQIEAFYREAPPKTMKVLREDIMDNVNGFQKVEMRGLPKNQKLEIDFTNFKPVKLLGKIFNILESEILAPEEETDHKAVDKDQNDADRTLPCPNHCSEGLCFDKECAPCAFYCPADTTAEVRSE